MAVREPCYKCDMTGRIVDKQTNPNVPPFRPQLCNDCDGTGFKLSNEIIPHVALIVIGVFAIFLMGLFLGITIS